MDRATLLWCLLSAVAFAPTQPARAQSTDEDDATTQAKAHFESGREFYKAQDYDKAIHEFQAAQALKPSPLLENNIGLCFEQLGKNAEAIAHYRRYLDQRPDAPNRAELETRIAELSPPPAATAAPTCPRGQSMTEDTAGHCCWPGQVWSNRRQICAGIPQCPPRFHAVGESCIVGSLTPPAPLAPNPWFGWGPPPPRGTVPVTITSKRVNYHYLVRSGTQSCTAPCMLYLAPGKRRITVGEDGHFETVVAIPQAPAAVRIEHLRMGNLISGSILLGLGVTAIVGGAIAYAYSPPGTNTLGNGLAIVSGIVLVPIGIPILAMSDRNRIVVTAAGYRTDRDAPSLRLAAVGLAPTAGGANAALTFTW